jgi:hypothetical protein
MGGVLGIDVTSHRHQALEIKEQQPVARVGGKIQVLKREEVAVWEASIGVPMTLNIVKRSVMFTIDDYDSNEKKQVSTRPDFEDLGTPRARKLCNALEQKGSGAHPVMRETL